MAGKHAAPKPSPYAIAAGAVAYATAITFAKHLPTDVISFGPAAVAVVVGAVERGIAEFDPKVSATVSRLANQADGAARDLAADVSAGVKEAPVVAADVAKVEAEVKPLI